MVVHNGLDIIRLNGAHAFFTWGEVLQLPGAGIIDEEAVSLRDNPDIAVMVGGDLDGVGIGLVDEICLQYGEVVDGITVQVEIMELSIDVVHIVVPGVINENSLTTHLNREVIDFTCLRYH